MAAIPNTANFGIARGRISHIKLFPNNDGSKKYMITVAPKNAYPNPDGSFGCQYVRTEGFVPKNARDDGVYQYLEVGDLVEINYIVLNDDYRDKSGQMHYGTVLRVQGVDILETKAAKAARKAAQAQNQAQAPAQNVVESIEGNNSAFMTEVDPDTPIFN